MQIPRKTSFLLDGPLKLYYYRRRLNADLFLGHNLLAGYAARLHGSGLCPRRRRFGLRAKTWGTSRDEGSEMVASAGQRCLLPAHPRRYTQGP